MKIVDEPSILYVRTRGLHPGLKEWRVLVDDQPVDGSIWDAVAHLYLNGRLQSREDVDGGGPGIFMYCSKLETPECFAYWRDLFREIEADPAFAIQKRGDTHPTIQFAALVETFPCLARLEECARAGEERLAILNSGRYDFQFSLMKTFAHLKIQRLPHKKYLGFLSQGAKWYDVYISQVCEKLGLVKVGGMFAKVLRELGEEPLENDFAKDTIGQSRHKKERERWLALKAEYDRLETEITADKKGEIARGTLTRAWAASPFMAPVVAEVFWKAGKNGELIFSPELKNHRVSASDLLDYPNVTDFPLTEEDFFDTVLATLEYMGPWLNDLGCVAPRGAMEDMATAEISRSQIWQWLHKGVCIDNQSSTPVNLELLQRGIDHSLKILRKRWTDRNGKALVNERGIALLNYFNRAARLLVGLLEEDEPIDFLPTVMVPEFIADFDPAAKLRNDSLVSRS
jgi:malate synthase